MNLMLALLDRLLSTLLRIRLGHEQMHLQPIPIRSRRR